MSATPGASTATTQGVRVSVRSQYLEEQSVPSSGRFVFAYTVTITNEGSAKVQLRTRHWIITDADDTVREVKGEGVVGKQPSLAPGESFEYTSGCILQTSWGTMQGTYQMHLEDGRTFDAEISPFLLAASSIPTVRDAN